MVFIWFTVLKIFSVKTSDGFGKFDLFTNPNSKHITTETIHCTQVTKSGAFNCTVSLLKSALFTNTVTIEITLFFAMEKKQTK